MMCLWNTWDKPAQLAERTNCIGELTRFARWHQILVDFPFDKISSSFQNYYCWFHPKNNNNVSWPGHVLNPRLQDKGPSDQQLYHRNTKTSLRMSHNFGESIASILFWKLEYWSPWRSRQFSGQSSSFVPGVVKWIKYTICTERVLLLPLPGNTGSCKHFEFDVAPQIARFRREACKHFEFCVTPQIARFRRLRTLWTDWKTGFTRHDWT